MIDWDRVNQLRDEIGTEDFREVVDMFLEEVDEIVERLCTSPDPSHYEEDLHFLKGSALNLGFRKFSALCAEGEQKSAAGDAGSVEIDPVIACYRDSKAQFLPQLETGQAA